MFWILGARWRWHKILEFVPSFPIHGWLAWWCDFFPVGPTFEDHPQVFSQKRSSPLEFIFDTCALAFSWWSWTYVVVAFCKDKFIFSKKTCVLHFGRALTQNSWICPIMSYLWMVGLVMRLFSCGANLRRSSAGIQPKEVQPLGIYFWHLRLWPLQVTFLGWWSWTYVVVDLCKDKCMFNKKTCVLDFGRALALTQNFWICPVISYLWMVGLVMRLFSCGANLWRSSACIQPKKGPAPWNLFLTRAPWPLQVTFLVGEAEHMWL